MFTIFDVISAIIQRDIYTFNSSINGLIFHRNNYLVCACLHFFIKYNKYWWCYILLWALMFITALLIHVHNEHGRVLSKPLFADSKLCVVSFINYRRSSVRPLCSYLSTHLFCQICNSLLAYLKRLSVLNVPRNKLFIKHLERRYIFITTCIIIKHCTSVVADNTR